MKYTSLYRNIKNPLDDDYVLEQLIESYTENRDFYSALTKRNSKNKKNQNNPSACDDLHAYLFNRWKKELLSITKEQYEQAIKDGLYDRDIFKLLEFLKTVPTLTKRVQTLKVLDASYKDKELEEAIEKYRWDSIGLYSGWTHIAARYINGKKTRNTKIEHRLYLNTAQTDVHTMSKLFLEKCTAKNLPFYFKISEFECRDDNIVIYSDTENLPKYLEVLYEIEKEHPELISRCGRPPILSGILHNWIGYGSEPLALSGESSFNSLRAKSIEKSIDEELKAWYKKNITATIRYKGQEVSLYDYLCEQIVTKRMKQLSDRLQKNPNAKWIKYTAQDLSNPAFIAKLTSEVKRNAKDSINKFLYGTEVKSVIKVPLNSNDNTIIYPSDIEHTLKEFIVVIIANNPNFKNRIREKIKQDAINYGIDPDNYCFDKENIELLKKAEQASSKSFAKKTTPTKEEQGKKQSSQHEETAKYHRPAGTPIYYKPMTDEEILEAQRQIAECPPVKVKRR